MFVAGPVYDLVPDDVALLGALVAGGAATALSIRWNAQVMGWLGLLGALWAPAVLGTGDGTEHVFLLIAYTATIAVLVWRRWTVLAGFAFVSATLHGRVLADGSELARARRLYGALAAALAFGFEANRRGLHARRDRPARRARARSWLAAALLVLGAALLALAGWFALDGELWLTALAVAHIALGLVATRVPRISRELALITLAIGIVLANIAFAVGRLRPAAGDRLGPVRPPVRRRCSAPAARVTTSRLADLILGRPHAADRILALAGLASQVSLAVFQGLLFDARPTELAGPFASDGALAAAGALAVVAWSCGRLAGPRWRAGSTCSRWPRSPTSPGSRSRASR